MGLLRSSLSNIRTDHRLLKIPPYVSLLCILGGIAWILLLPLDQYSRRTYISENALLPGQVHTYFYGTDQNVFRAYYREVAEVIEPQIFQREDGTQEIFNATVEARSNRIRDLFANSGIKSATQTYTYTAAGVTYKGENVYAINHAPRGDGTESIVLVAPIVNHEGKLNTRGVTLLISLGRYFSRWSLWSKDIILLVTPDTTTGPQAWIDAYLSQHNPDQVSSLSLKSGHIQGAICIDFPVMHNFHALHISYDGVNGQLPNLDLINTATAIAQTQAGMPTLIQHQHEFSNYDNQHHYMNRLRVLLNGMRNQAVGQSTGPHSVFMPYHIDAITLTSVGEGREDEMAFGRVVESLVRSLNNLLEKLHQSFFFYLLLQNNRFVSIGTYLPSAMAIGASFTVMAIYLWLKSGYEQSDVLQTTQHSQATERDAGTLDQTAALLADPEVDTAALLRTKTAGGPDLSSKKQWKAIDRPIALPLAILTAIYLASVLPVTMIVHTKRDMLVYLVGCLSAITLGLPVVLAAVCAAMARFENTSSEKPSHANGNVKKEEHVVRFIDLSPASKLTARIHQFYMVFKSLCLLVLGLQLTVLATLNFSLSMLLGVLCVPLAFAGFYPNSIVKASISVAAVYLMSPPIILVTTLLTTKDLGIYPSELPILDILSEWLEILSFGWNVLGAWGVLIGIFCVWLPAWAVAGACSISSFLIDEDDDSIAKESKARPSMKESVNNTKVPGKGIVKNKK